MDTILFLALLALLYYLHVRDRWWIGFAALITILLKLGHTITIYTMVLYIFIAKVLKEAFQKEE